MHAHVTTKGKCACASLSFCVSMHVCLQMRETVTRSLKQKQPLRNEQQRLGDINISVRCVEKERETERERETWKQEWGGDPCHSKAFPWLTELVRLRMCVCVCVSLLAHVPFPHTHPTPTLTIVCTTSVTFPLIRSLNQWLCPKL